MPKLLTMTRKTRYKVGPLYLVCDARLKEGSEVIFPQNSCAVLSIVNFWLPTTYFIVAPSFILTKNIKRKNIELLNLKNLSWFLWYFHCYADQRWHRERSCYVIMMNHHSTLASSKHLIKKDDLKHSISTNICWRRTADKTIPRSHA